MSKAELEEKRGPQKKRNVPPMSRLTSLSVTHDNPDLGSAQWVRDFAIAAKHGFEALRDNRVSDKGFGSNDQRVTATTVNNWPQKKVLHAYHQNASCAWLFDEVFVGLFRVEDESLHCKYPALLS